MINIQLRFQTREGLRQRGNEYIIISVRIFLAVPDAGGSSFHGDHFAFFRSSYITWTRACRPDEAVLVLSPSLHSRRQRKLRTSFPRGGCPTEIQLIRSGNFPAARLNRRATASGLCAWHRKRMYVRTCVHACARESAVNDTPVQEPSIRHTDASVSQGWFAFRILINRHPHKTSAARWASNENSIRPFSKETHVLCDCKPLRAASTRPRSQRELLREFAVYLRTGL